MVSFFKKLCSDVVSSHKAKSDMPMTGELLVSVLACLNLASPANSEPPRNAAIKIPIIKITKEISKKEKALIDIFLLIERIIALNFFEFVTRFESCKRVSLKFPIAF